MRVATFNVNGIGSRLGALLQWLDETQPDVACLQELKAPQERFPLAEINAAGYGAIWQFAMGALREIPFASLDDISFRRDGIQDPTVEARLRLTLYLKDVPGAAP